MTRILLPIFAVAVMALAGCTTSAKMAEKRDPIFQLHDLHIINRDLTMPPP